MCDQRLHFTNRRTYHGPIQDLAVVSGVLNVEIDS